MTDFMATFHPFPRLPYELRAVIWEMTVEPRLVSVKIQRESFHQREGKFLTSSSPPAVLQVCREARNYGLYQKCFNEIANPSKGLQYVWANLDIDTIDIGESHFQDFKPVAESIRRLRIQREMGTGFKGEYFYEKEARELDQFVNMEELYIVAGDGLFKWEDIWNDNICGWVCGFENVFFIDPEDEWKVYRGYDGLNLYHKIRGQRLYDEMSLSQQELGDKTFLHVRTTQN